MNRRFVQKKFVILLIAAFFIIAAILIGSSISGLAETGNVSEHSCKYYTSITVEKGDTLWSIASEYMTAEYPHIEDYIMEVRELNHLADNGIYAGEYLTIPYYSSDTL